jgi:energy-coupling factor transporter ATP-binding protein EcfA2
MKILFNGIPSSGKSTLAYLLHLKLEHKGHETIYLDDEVIKRLNSKQVETLIDYINSPISIIVSCDPKIKADIKFWCVLPTDEAIKRNNEKLEKENAPKLGDYTGWEDYYSQGIKVDTTKTINDCLEVIKCVLKKKNLNF